MGFLGIAEILSGRCYNTCAGPEMFQAGIFITYNAFFIDFVSFPVFAQRSKTEENYILRYKYFALGHSRANACVIRPIQYAFGEVQKQTVIGRLLKSYLYRFFWPIMIHS